jgi:HEAT repeat protein
MQDHFRKNWLTLLTTGLVVAGIALLGWLAWRFVLHGQSRDRRYWVEAMKSEDGNIRFEAVQKLADMNRKSKELDPAVVAALKDENSDIRLTAAELLGERGLKDWDDELPPPEAMLAMPPLIPLLEDRHAGVRKEAARSILRIVGLHEYEGWKHSKRLELVRALSGAVQDKETRGLVRENAATVLSTMSLTRAEAKIAVPALLKAMKNNGSDQTIAKALKQIDPEAAAKGGIEDR